MGMKSLEEYRIDIVDVIKRQLGAAIRAKGGTVNDTDAWSAFISTLSNLQTKRWASGTATSSSASAIYIFPDGSTVSLYTLSVAGLNFTPSIVLIYRKSNNSLSQTVLFPEIIETANNAGRIIVAGYDANSQTGLSVNTIKLAGNANVGNGFTLPVVFASTLYNWIAFE